MASGLNRPLPVPSDVSIRLSWRACTLQVAAIPSRMSLSLLAESLGSSATQAMNRLYASPSAREDGAEASSSAGRIADCPTDTTAAIVRCRRDCQGSQLGSVQDRG